MAFLVPVPIRCRYTDPDGDPATSGLVSATAVGANRVPSASTVVAGTVSWKLRSGEIPGFAALLAPPSGTLFYAVTEKVSGTVHGPYVVPVTAADAATGIDLSRYQSNQAPGQVPTVTPPGVKGDKGDPGVSSMVFPEAGPVRSSPVPPTALLGKVTRFRGGITQALPPAVPDAVLAFGFDPADPLDAPPVFTADGADVIGADTATSLGDLLAGQTLALHCTTAGRWRAHHGATPGATIRQVAAAAAQPGPLVHTDYRRLPDGPLPALGDEGRRIVNPRNGVAGPYLPAVSSGRLVSNIAAGVAGASYIDQHLPGKVARIGAVFGFAAGDTDGSVTLAAWTTDLPDPVVTGSIGAHVHLVVQPTSWHYGLFQNGTFVEIANGLFNTPLPQDQSPLRVEARIDGATATIVLPDDSTAQVTDSRIAAISGVVASHEFFKYTGSSCLPVLYATWADTAPEPMGGESPTGVARLVGSLIPQPTVAKWSPSTQTKKAPPSSWAVIDESLTVTQQAGPTGAILLDWQGWLVIGAAGLGTIAWGVGVNGGGPSEAVVVRQANTVGDERVYRVQHLRTGLQPGQEYTLRWMHFAPAPDAGNYLDVNSSFGRFATVTATPM